MPLLVWNDGLSVGVEAIDRDHKKLVAMLNEIYDAVGAESSQKILDDLLVRLVQYTHFHFDNEEKLCAATGFPLADEHLKEHDEMRAWVREMRTACISGTAIGPSLQVANYLKNWLFGHILVSDKKLGAHLQARGVH